MSLPSAVHVSSTFEFGAMLHDCLCVDPQVQSSILPFFFWEPHECHCLALFMCPPPSSLELCFMIA